METMIKNHKKAARHIEDAAIYYRVAARFHGANSHHKAKKEY